MRLSPASAASAVVLAAAASLTLPACSGHSSPAWCGPFLTQVHVKSGTDLDYMHGLKALEAKGAPVAQLVKDQQARFANQAFIAANPTSVGAANAAVGYLNAVGADLKKLNSECGQPADAYKGDDS